MDIEAFVLARVSGLRHGPTALRRKASETKSDPIITYINCRGLISEDQAEERRKVKYYSWGKGGVRAVTPGAKFIYQRKGEKKRFSADRGKGLAEWRVNSSWVSTMLCRVLNGHGFSLRTKQITGSFIHDAHHCCLGTDPSY